MEDDGLLQGFFEESADLLAEFEECLLRLETTPEDQELLNKGFRAIHTIKGNSGMLGYDRIAAVAHGVEDLLGRLRKHEIPLTRPATDLLLQSADVIKRLFAGARGELFGPSTGSGQAEDGQGGEEIGGEELTRALEAFLAAAIGVERGPSGASPAHGMTPSAEVPPLRHGSGQGIGELLLDVEDRAASPAHVARALEQQADLLHKQESSTIRVSTEKVDKLINLVGELVITQSMVSQTVAAFSAEHLPLLEGAVAQMERNLRELQERVMAVRMLPIRTVFSRFPRLVRDLAKECGKEVAIQIKGEETELDKTVIERMSDPLTHLLRNAVDHGIEPPDQRLAQGKPAEGLIRLNAFHQGGSIYIEVADDGLGLDTGKILRKATEQGLICGDESLSDDQVYRLIFRPGFSTADQVTDISGRGVGMDVVLQNIEQLGGSIAIATEVGHGTQFTIKLPLTLAILDGLSIQVGDQVYIIPLMSITESIRPKQADLGTVLHRDEVVSVRGQLMPIVRLYGLFGITPKVADPTQSLLVIVEQEGRKVALLVDELLGQHQVVIKSLETNYQRVPGISGATIMGDGRVALILDVAGLIRTTQAHEAGASVFAAAA